MKHFLFSCCLLPFLLAGGVPVEKLAGQMTELSPEIREHLTQALAEISHTEDGQYLLEKISPEVRFSARPMALLGQAETRNVVTLEALRLENKVFQDKTEAQKQIKVCFTAEILSHELLHNAQFQNGLFRYPRNFSGYEAALCEEWMELQAKYTGEKMFHVLRSKEPFCRSVPEKSGLYLVTERQGGNPRSYAETLWKNDHRNSAGALLFRQQIREIANWHCAYAEQAFRNNYVRFAAGLPDAGKAALTAHLQKILDFLPLQVSAEFLLAHTPLRRIPHGIACFEDGKKVLELEAVPGGYRKRVFSGKIVRNFSIPFPK